MKGMVLKLVALLTLIMCNATYSVAKSNDWPTRPVEIIISYSAGGTSDVMTRIIANEMSQYLGQPVIVRPRPGGEGNISAMAVAKAKPDGYTVLSSSPLLTLGPLLLENINWGIKDFAPIGLFATSSGFIVSSATIPVKSIPELVTYVKQKPELPSAVLNGGAFTTFVTRMLGQEAGIKLLFVPYQGAAQHMADLYEGRVSLATLSGNLACASLTDEKLRVLAVTGDERSSLAPNIPAIGEEGFPAVDAQGWYGLHAPAGTPADRIAKLAEALAAAVKTDSVQQGLKNMCVNPQYKNTDDFNEFVKKDIKRWKKAMLIIESQKANDPSQ